MTEISDILRNKIINIKLLTFDADGVLTDGGVYIDDNGNEFRRFDIKDGMGLTQCIKVGYQIAIISSSASKPVIFRASGLGIEQIFIGVKDKLSCLKRVCEKEKINLENVIYMGDDLSDLPVLQVVGIACAPADAVSEIIDVSHYVCINKGGHGAVREVCDLLFQINENIEPK